MLRSISCTALLLACLGCSGHEHKVHREPSRRNALAELFLAFEPAAWSQTAMQRPSLSAPNLGMGRAGISATSMAVRPKAVSPGPNYEQPERIAGPSEPPGPRDVIMKLYNIGTPELASAISFVVNKKGYWFPKLSISVGKRVWSYDGIPEQTYDEIIENAAGEPPLRTWNLGPTKMSDGDIDKVIAEMAATDYTPKEYDFFFRNCNHFCVDLAERLEPERGWSAEESEFVEGRVLHESEAIINKMPEFQQKATRAFTWQIQKIIVKAWRKEWKRALGEYEEKNAIPLDQRVGAT